MRERIRSTLGAAVATSIAALLLPAGALAQGEPETRRPNPVVAAFDVVILRPLGLVAIAVGAGAFVPAALITSPHGRDGIRTALEIFVVEPTKSVFQRPLGDF